VNKKAISFEEALERLEHSIEQLEEDDLTLDKALAYFEEGIGLIRQCDEQLKKANGRLVELLKDERGEYIEKVLGINLQSVLGGEDFDE
jgi:exodeoxyribonuclease VII small subunit